MSRQPKIGQWFAACKVCGRTLTNPKSVTLNIGPECRSQMNGQRVGGSNDRVGHRWVGEFTGDIIIGRAEDGTVEVNIPQFQVKHSDTGFEFGYGGSGPADLAYNVLLCYTDPDTADLLHQDFKSAFIATLDQQKGGTIKGDDIKAWLSKARNGRLFVPDVAPLQGSTIL